VANKPEVNILLCTSQQTTRAALPHEVILDAADGLGWATLCKCDLLHSVAKDRLTGYRGTVTAERRRQIIATINRANGWL
jgi:mRNA-degrading endonuclease toxin of MazEF toxin-antitoxin module